LFHAQKAVHIFSSRICILHCVGAHNIVPDHLSAALALVPLTLDAQASGNEILDPVAIVIIGGLISSTLLDMIVTPVVFWRIGGKALKNYFRYNESEF
jgi:hypothetical protein